MFDKNKTEFFLFRTIGFLLGLGKIKNAKSVAKILAFFLYFIFPIRKETVRKNLQQAFPTLDKKKIKKIIYKNYYSFSITLCEIFRIKKMTEEELYEIISCKNSDEIYKKLKQDRGAFLLTAHFGNWELGAIYFGVKGGNGIHVLAKPQRNNYVTNWFTNMRATFGNTEIKLGVSVREIIKAIRAGRIVGVVGDQRGPKEGIRVEFFNTQTAVYPGTAAIALKMDAPIFATFVLRKPDFTYEFKLHEIKIENISNITVEEKIKNINQIYMKLLEEYVRENPEQWFWMHKIWKY